MILNRNKNEPVFDSSVHVDYSFCFFSTIEEMEIILKLFKFIENMKTGFDKMLKE